MSKKSFGYIYLILDHYTHKVYVGQKLGDPIKTTKYFGSGKQIKEIIKTRHHHLEKRIIGLCKNKKELDKAETECIYFYRAYGSDGQNYDEIYGYNLTPKAKSGNFGHKHSTESLLKMSNSQKIAQKDRINKLSKKDYLKWRKSLKVKKANTVNMKIAQQKRFSNPIEKEKMKTIASIYRKKNIKDEMILKLLDCGKTQRQIADQLGCSRGLIQNRINKLI